MSQEHCPTCGARVFRRGRPGRPPAMTADEAREAMRLKAAGYSWRIVAAQLHVAPGTARRAVTALEAKGVTPGALGAVGSGLEDDDQGRP